MENDSTIDGQEPAKNIQPVQTGNASNPSPHASEEEAAEEQLLSNKAEKYLREVASIEDVPDAQDQNNMDKEIAQEKRQSE